MRNSGLFEASSLSHDTGRSGPEQDRTASYIVLYMSGALGLVYAGTAGLSYSWPALIFALTALLQLLLARAMQRVDDADRAARWKYVDGFKLPVVLLLGLLQVARLRLTSKLVTYRTMGIVYMDVLEALALAGYVIYVLWRYRSPKFRFAVLGGLQVVSLLSLASAFLYLHIIRPRRHAHIEHDWRLLYMALANYVPALLLIFGVPRFPAWMLDFIGILCTTLFWVSCGHDRLKGF